MRSAAVGQRESSIQFVENVLTMTRKVAMVRNELRMLELCLRIEAQYSPEACRHAVGTQVGNIGGIGSRLGEG